MMRFRLLLLALLGGLGLARPARAQVFYLDLSAQPISLPVRTMHVEQVLDGRPAGSPSLGLVYQGLNNRPATVEFRRGLAPELTEWLQQRLPALAGDQPVVLCVRQLRVSEVIGGFGEKAKAELAFDVYAHLPDGYHFVRRLSGHDEQAGLDMTLTHATNVARVLQKCLQLLAAMPWQQAAQQPALRLEQLVADKPVALALPPVLRAAVPARGIYHRPAQFLANEPDTTLSLGLDTLYLQTPGWEGTARLRPSARTPQGSRVSPRELWGFSDGRQAYIRHGSAFRPLVRQGDFYTFVSGAPVDVQVAKRRSTNIIMYGAVGGLLTSDGDDITGRPVVYALDVRTGQAGPFPLPGQAPPIDTAFVYVYRPPGGPAAAQRLLVNNQEVGWLRPGDFLEVPCRYLGRAVRFSLSQPDGPTLLVVPDAKSANYLKLTTHSKACWEWMPPRLGAADVDALEQLRKR
ncbi:hypothetical protein Q5H93_05995 [Hymenobacter sp. ASUV-10]|uniref:DUF4136 domain-containing protein n=1 Tax=Hymenobacter aranciens TaxID=3063996 RepID=A0ABT9B7Y5_9BACT|nr:hypothetical protein [Hymenobacter sp. ASUV-10]MDO7874277.1 hypothetical protein [Hymenobacter sp. ASUV-10]